MLRNLFLGTWSCFYRAAVLSNTGVTSQVWLYKTELLLLLFSHSVMSNSLWHHGLQHARLPCPSPSPGDCWSSCPLSQRCHPTISSSVIPFSSHPQSFPASGSFLMGWLFASGGQSIGASVSALVLPMNIQDWFTVRLTGLISLQIWINEIKISLLQSCHISSARWPHVAKGFHNWQCRYRPFSSLQKVLWNRAINQG